MNEMTQKRVFLNGKWVSAIERVKTIEQTAKVSKTTQESADQTTIREEL